MMSQITPSSNRQTTTVQLAITPRPKHVPLPLIPSTFFGFPEKITLPVTLLGQENLWAKEELSLMGRTSQ